MVGRDLGHLVGPPARQHRAAFGAAPGQGVEHARIGMQQRRQCGGQVGAAQAELEARIGGRFDFGAQAALGQHEPARRIEADRLGDTRIAAAAKAQQCGIERS